VRLCEFNNSRALFLFRSPDRGEFRLFQKPSKEQRRKLYRDIGIFTLIPTMMIVGPVIGYLLGRLVENKWGLAPWPSAGGALFGLAAVVRQIWILLKQHGDKG
jgi:hypothetical protein